MVEMLAAVRAIAGLVTRRHPARAAAESDLGPEQAAGRAAPSRVADSRASRSWDFFGGRLSPPPLISASQPASFCFAIHGRAGAPLRRGGTSGSIARA